jgi:hypothetical protein
LLAAGALVVALAVPSAAQAKTLKVNVTVPNANVVTNPPGLFTSPTPPPPGAYTFAGFGSFTGAGGGRLVFNGIVATDHETLISAVFQFRGGSISVFGVSTDTTSDTEYYSITGGTRKYRGIRGDAKLYNETSSDDPTGADKFSLKFDY